MKEVSYMNIKFRDAVKIGAGLSIGWKLSGWLTRFICCLPDALKVMLIKDKDSSEYKRSVKNLKRREPEVYDMCIEEGYIVVEQETRRKIGF
jgi:hypothetical protein